MTMLCVKKFSELQPPAKALRFAQVETRLDLLTQLRLAALALLLPDGGAK